MEEFSWGFILLIVFGLAIAGGVSRWLVVSWRAAGKSVAGSWLPLAWLCVAGLVGLFLIATLVGPRQSSNSVFEAAIQRAAGHSIDVEFLNRDQAVPAALVDDGEVWRDVVEEQFDTNIYPSTTQAAKALGRQVAAHVNFNVLARDTSPTRIKVIDRSRLNDEGQAAQALARHLQAEFEVPTAIHPEHFQVPGKISSPGEVLVVLNLSHLQARAGAPWDSSIPERTGTLEATAIGQQNRVTVATQFIDKPWVTRFDEFISRRPESTFLLARTASFYSSEQAAHLEAADRAAESVSQIILPLVPPAAGPTEVRSDMQVQLRNTARWLIQSGHLVKDRFAQKLTRPYGEVWREAVLIELTPSQINGLRNHALEISSLRHRESVTFHGGLLGLFALVVVLYLFLNLATKGYYQARLAAWLSGGLIVTGLAFALIWQARSNAELTSGFPRNMPFPVDEPPSAPKRAKTALAPVHETESGRIQPKPATVAPPALAKPVATATPLNEAGSEDEGKIDPVPKQESLRKVD
ncbi:MAG: hypothetical protein O2820_08830 [Planctomycetota bacterium]|nr:hypothetical protein [Planctomycetota bacterium]MDA1249316.1 hypothetical protein [Planctomycetota bacterium]